MKKLYEKKYDWDLYCVLMTTQKIKRLAELTSRVLKLSQDEQKEYLTLRNKQHQALESLGYEMEWDKENLIFYYVKTEVPQG